MSHGDAKDALELFGPECYWRDLVAFTWNIRTCEGREEICAMLGSCLASIQPGNFSLKNAPVADPAAESFFTFETAAGRGIGHLRLREGKCWTLLTALRELENSGSEPELARARLPG